jgi:transposase-like protein
MAHLDVKFHENRVEIISQVFCCDIHDTWENRKVWFVVLRTLRCPESGKPLFSYQAIAEAFGYQARQNIHNFIHEYEQCHENLFDYLRHKRKVDPVVVEAVRDELRHEVLITSKALRLRVNQRLGRTDLTSGNIRVALEQIPCRVIRRSVLREIAAGAFHVKEEVVLTELFAMCEQGEVRRIRGAVRSCSPHKWSLQSPDVVMDDPGEADTGGDDVRAGEPERRVVSHEQGHASAKLLRYAEMVSAAGIQAIRAEPDEAVIQKTQADSVRKLLTPNCPISAIPKSVVRMVTAMTMYYSGVSLSRIGRWFGEKAKSTIYTWIMGLAVALWPVIQGWIWSHVKGTRMYIDEKWLKIRKKWYYWFVAVDQQSELPYFSDLVPTRSKWACRLFLLKLKRLGTTPSKIMTDGLKGYVSAIAKVFPTTKHLLCLFHHQQTVTRCVKEQFCETEQEVAKAAKKRMKQVVQTTDTRTMRRRLNRLEQAAKQKGWSILNWLKQTRNKLEHFVPAIRSNSYPATTNAIERFFREFVRFYKTRCGFHSVTSAKRELLFFLVVYLFTIQPESGNAPIEKIIPEANTMPLYHLLNYPFGG